jgi:chitinase
VIQVYIAQGIPASKINVGMPLYGRAFTNTAGIGKPYQGVGAGSWEQGVWDFKALPQPGAQEIYDAESGASYSYDPNAKTLVSYDNLDMVKKKAEYIKNHGLGGSMWWELSGDRQDNGSLVTNVSTALISNCSSYEKFQLFGKIICTDVISKGRRRTQR